MAAQKIVHAGVLYGIKLTGIKPGTTPISQASDPLQVLTLSHVSGTVITPHIHSRTKRTTLTMQKALVVISGRIRIDIYNPKNKKKVVHVYIKTGQSFILLAGGWSITFIEPSKLFEFKNGPFLNDRTPL